MQSPSFSNCQKIGLWTLQTFTDVICKRRAESLCHTWSLSRPARPINQGQRGGIPPHRRDLEESVNMVSHTTS